MMRVGPLLRRFKANTAGRDLIVGDVHGQFTKLRAALDAVGFDPAAGDRLFSVGDLVDRGPESPECLWWLEQPWFMAVRGNHEDFAILWADRDPGFSAVFYAECGGAWNIGQLPHERIVFADAFRDLPLAIELATAAGLVGIVHAHCPTLDWHAFTVRLQDPEILGNPGRLEHLTLSVNANRDRSKGYTDGDVIGVRAVVVGHQPVISLTSLDNHVYIDTASHRHGTGKFTILDAATLRPACKKSPLRW